jgi:hypothetical protein
VSISSYAVVVDKYTEGHTVVEWAKSKDEAMAKATKIAAAPEDERDGHVYVAHIIGRINLAPTLEPVGGAHA